MTGGSLAVELSWLWEEGGAHPPTDEAVEREGGRTGAGLGGQTGLLRSHLSGESHTNLNAQNGFRNLARLKISSSLVGSLSASEPVAVLI